MDFNFIFILISVLAISSNRVSGEFDDFCTLSGTIRGLESFSSIFVKL